MVVGIRTFRNQQKSPGNSLRFVAVAGAFRIRIGISERLLFPFVRIRRTKENPRSGGTLAGVQIRRFGKRGIRG